MAKKKTLTGKNIVSIELTKGSYVTKLNFDANNNTDTETDIFAHILYQVVNRVMELMNANSDYVYTLLGTYMDWDTVTLNERFPAEEILHHIVSHISKTGEVFSVLYTDTEDETCLIDNAHIVFSQYEQMLNHVDVGEEEVEDKTVHQGD